MKIELPFGIKAEFRTISKWLSAPDPYFKQFYAPFNQRWNYRIAVIINGHEMRFTWHDSIRAWAEGENKMDKEKYICAFSNYVDDAIAYMNNASLGDFVNEFGYDTEDFNAEEVYAACGEAYNELMSEFTDQELCDLANRLEEMI